MERNRADPDNNLGNVKASHKSEEEVNNNLEHKSIDLEIIEVKQEGDKGFFKAYLNTYNNIDFGRDVTRKSFGDMNIGNVVSLLKQHLQGTEHGMLTLGSDNKGITIDGVLYLQLIEGTHTPVFDQAHKTYELLKAGASGGVPVKFSMGYRITEKKQSVVDGIQVRELIKGIIMEGSIVTFPMNPESVQTQVKEEGGNEVPEQAEQVKTELKAMDMQQMMNMEEMERKLGDMPYQFSRSNRMAMRDPKMSMMDKMTMINKNCAYMMAEYPKMAMDMMKMTHGEDGMMMTKSDNEAAMVKMIDDMEAEFKSFETEMNEAKAEGKKMDPIKCGMMASKMMGKAMMQMKKGGMMDPEFQMNPETHKNPEGKDDEQEISIKGMMSGFLSSKNKEGDK